MLPADPAIRRDVVDRHVARPPRPVHERQVAHAATLAPLQAACRDGCVEFPLADRADGVLRFSGLTVERRGADGLTMHLAMRIKDGTLREERFEYRRAGLG